MSAARLPKAEAEARDWFERLGRTSITTAELYAFRDWRDNEANDAAYTRLERETPMNWGRFLVQPSANGFAVVDSHTGEPASFAKTTMIDLDVEDANDVARLLAGREGHRRRLAPAATAKRGRRIGHLGVESGR
ncbi:hypothetical protein [Phenylobacterium sp.]|jgi:hypothetical protein|uniref:hypothetical protein n=1 Tax=Phenylobacterium sp. TaxID=1871053 RepID=UPI002E325F8B|nr:hypothetical protein [Phenylobacterium sp.]HEX3365373.1 hypothetical protein [Phenylobacterium sp.]